MLKKWLVSIENVKIHFNGGGNINDVKLPLEEKINAYPNTNMFGNIPAYGMFMRHASNTNIKNIKMTMSKSEKRFAIFTQDVEKINLNNWELPFVDTGLALISLESSKDLTISGFKETGGKSQKFLSVNGNETKGIKIDKSIIGEIILGEGVYSEAVKKM